MPMHPEEFTTIAVDLSLDDRAILVVPRDSAASAVLQQVLDHAPESLTLHSGGMAGSHELITGAYLYFGGEYYERTEGNRTTIDYHGAIKIYLDLSNVNEESISKLRLCMWYGITVDSSASVDNFCLMSAVDCKSCGKAITAIGEMEWRTCDDCAINCDHQYVEGVGAVNGHIAHMPFCNLCGRGDPDWQPSEDSAEDMLNTVVSGDLAALVLVHQDGSITSITEQ